MPKTTNARPQPARQFWLTRPARKRAPWHWFDHPDMQARIATAEADRREGRVTTFDSRESALAYLHSQL
jgi:hypothetical protein